jgi:hypothetical protein
MTAQHRGIIARGCGLVIAAAIVASTGASAPRDFVSDHLADPANPTTRIHGSDAPETLKILFLGDGFTADGDSIGAYRTAVDQMTAELLATEPFQPLASALTIYRMDVISDQALIDVPVACPEGSTVDMEQFDLPPPPGGTGPPGPFQSSRSPRNPNNALDTHWCAVNVTTGGPVKRMLNSESTRISEFVQASGVAPNITVVLVNDFAFGATAWASPGVLYASIAQNLLHEINPDTKNPYPSRDAADVSAMFVHEIGHMEPFSLLDEYANDPARPGIELAAEQVTIDNSPNISTQQNPAKWAPFGATGVLSNCAPDANPPAPEVGAVPGGYGFASDVFHSRCKCKMDDWHDSFCVVCRDRVFQQLGLHVPGFDGARDPPMDVPSAPEAKADGPPRKLPPPLWVILDSLWLRSGPSGKYSIDYIITMGSQRVSGTWPRGRGASLTRGESLQIGDLLAILTLNESPASFVSFDYNLRWFPPVADRTVEPTLVAHEQWRGQLSELRSGIVTVNRPSHQLTIGLVTR